MEFDALLLSRLQFAFTIGFHIIFPAFTIGLASFLAVLEGLWLATKKPVYRNLYLFWVKIFALSFGMGVVSGVDSRHASPREYINMVFFGLSAGPGNHGHDGWVTYEAPNGGGVLKIDSIEIDEAADTASVT